MIEDLLTFNKENKKNLLDKYPIYKTENGFKSNIGEWYQKRILSNEIQSAITVYDKYRRKYNLDKLHLHIIESHIIKFVTTRKEKGKNTQKDHMIQEASSFVKKTFQ